MKDTEKAFWNYDHIRSLVFTLPSGGEMPGLQ